MISGNAHCLVSPWLVAAIPLLGSWLVVRSLEIVKLFDFLQIVKCAKGNKRNVLGKVLGKVLVQGKMCHSQCRHDPEGPRTKTNPPSHRGRIIQADKRQVMISRLLVDISSKQTKISSLDKNVLRPELLKRGPQSTTSGC